VQVGADRSRLVRLLAPVLLALVAAPAGADPFAAGDACFVRPEPSPAATSAAAVLPAASESRLGIRRKTGQLFDVEIAVVGTEGALCAVSGVARLRPGDTLVLPVRPEPGKATKAEATPCLVSLRNVAGAVEVQTTEPACRAQALCAGQVQLDGQRFEPATRVTAGGRTPCFGAPT
jgi:hypothetical protein